MKRSGAVLILSCVLALALACEGDAEEDVAGDDDLTAAEVWDEVVRTAAGLDSVQVDVVTITQPGGATERETRITTGQGSYTKIETSDQEDGECGEDDGEVQPGCDVPYDERLWLGDKLYFRQPATGAWVSAETAAGTVSLGSHSIAQQSTTVEIVGPDGSGFSSLSSEEFSRALSVLPFLSDDLTELELTDEAGMRVLNLAFTVDLPGAPPAPIPSDVPDDIRQQIEDQLADLPARYDAVVEFRVSDRFLPVTAVMELTSYAADGEPLLVETRTYEYSLWNEAELPGPLPE